MAFTRSGVRLPLAPPTFAATGSKKHVYVLESINFPHETCIGLTDDLRTRVVAHNSGQAKHTRKFKPWRLVSYLGFSDPEKAVAFERYLKSSSGRAFAKKRLR